MGSHRALDAAGSGMRDALTRDVTNGSLGTTCSSEAITDDFVSFTPVSADSRALARVPQSDGLRRRQRHFQGRSLGGRSRRVRSTWLNIVRSFEAGSPLMSESGDPRPFHGSRSYCRPTPIRN